MNAQSQAAPRLDFTYIPPEPAEEVKPSETEQLAKSLVSGFEKIGEKLDKMAEDPSPQPNYSTTYNQPQDRQQDRQEDTKADPKDDIDNYVGVAVAHRVDPNTGVEEAYVPTELLDKVLEKRINQKLQGVKTNDPFVEELKQQHQFQQFREGIKATDTVFQGEGGDRLVDIAVDAFYSKRNPAQDPGQRVMWAIEQAKQIGLPNGNPTLREVAARAANAVGQTSPVSTGNEPMFPKGATIVIDRLAPGESGGSFDDYQKSIAFERELVEQSEAGNLGWKIQVVHPLEDPPQGSYRIGAEAVRRYVHS